MTTSIRSLAVLLLAGPITAFANSSGIFDRSTAGCTGNGCHAVAAIPTTRVCISGLPTDGTYAPDADYPLTVFVDGFGIPPEGFLDPAANLAGFNFSASSGTLSIASGDLSLRFPAAAESANPNQLSHTFDGNKQNHWDLTWKAPSAGLATLSLAGNAVNGSRASDALDLWNTTAVTLTAGTGGAPGMLCDPPLPLPQIFPVPAASAALAAH